MKISYIVQLAKEYDALLTRYARWITKEQVAAERIVLKVFERYYEGNTVLSGIALRRYLQSRVARDCKEWLQNRSARFSDFHRTSLN